MLWFTFSSPDIGTFLLDVTGISLFISGKRVIWFVTAIVICYAIYPLLYSANQKTDNSVWMLAIMLFICITLNAILRYNFQSFWKNSEILFRRIPIFAIGFFVESMYMRDILCRFQLIKVPLLQSL